MDPGRMDGRAQPGLEMGVAHDFAQAFQTAFVQTAMRVQFLLPSPMSVIDAQWVSPPTSLAAFGPQQRRDPRARVICERWPSAATLDLGSDTRRWVAS